MPYRSGLCGYIGGTVSLTRREGGAAEDEKDERNNGICLAESRGGVELRKEGVQVVGSEV